MKKIVAIMMAMALTGGMVYAQQYSVKDGIYFDNEGHPLSGVHKETTDNGAAEFTFNNGEKHGKATYYFENGAVKETGSFADGYKTGEWQQFHADGSKASVGEFKNGKKSGQWKVWDANGNLRFDMSYDNGKKSGTWLMYDESGALSMERSY